MSQNKINTVWTYNDVQLELDLADVETLERYHNVFSAMEAEEKAIKRDVPNYTFARSYCELFHHLFDSLFGEGTFDKLTGGKVLNMTAANDVYESFLSFASEQTNAISREQNRLVDKYSANRAQRRAAAKGRV